MIISSSFHVERGVERVVIGSVQTTRRIWAIFSPTTDHNVNNTHLTYKCVCVSSRAARPVKFRLQICLPALCNFTTFTCLNQQVGLPLKTKREENETKSLPVSHKPPGGFVVIQL